MGVPQNRWFTRENPSINGCFGGTPMDWKLHESTTICQKKTPSIFKDTVTIEEI